MARFQEFAPTINAKRVLAAMRKEAVPLVDPLLRLQGRRSPEGGAAALRTAWNEAMRRPLVRERSADKGSFDYTSFGPPGTVASDTREPALGIRTIRYANGVALNLKRTDLDKDRILLQLALDGGTRLNTRARPLTTEMTGSLPAWRAWQA